VKNFFKFTFVTSSPEHTGALAVTTSQALRAGIVILLSGQLGTGKSVFARHLIRHLLTSNESDEDIPSPTYTLIQTYQGQEYEIWHADLYRLQSVDEIIELGLEEAFYANLCVVEWGDKLEHFTPTDALNIQFEYNVGSSSTRTVIMTTTHPELGRELTKLFAANKQL